jgi:hypothetical protein
MFAAWCDTLPAHRLEQVRRFTEPWQAEASRGLRTGEPAAAAAYAKHRRLHTVHPALLAERVARTYANLSTDGASVAITTARVETARAINRAIQLQRRSHHTTGVRLADGTSAHVGDQVATRRNNGERTNQGVTVRNRQVWTVVAVERNGWLTVEDPDRGRVSLPRATSPSTSSWAGRSPATAARASPRTTPSASSSLGAAGPASTSA